MLLGAEDPAGASATARLKVKIVPKIISLNREEKLKIFSPKF